MEMDKTFEQLKTHLIDLCHGASSRCEKVLTEFEEKYTTLKGLFVGSSGKPLRIHEEGTKNDILSCERSLEGNDNKKGNEHYVHTFSIEKLCTEDLNGKNEDACATSIEVHIIPDENVDILPLPIKRSRRDYGKVCIIQKKKIFSLQLLNHYIVNRCILMVFSILGTITSTMWLSRSYHENTYIKGEENK